MKHTSLALLLFLLTAVSAQTGDRIDSLKNALFTSKEDTNKVNLYVDLVWENPWAFPDTTLAYALPGLKLAKEINFVRGQMYIMAAMGEALGMKGNYSEALATQFEALELAKKLNDPDAVVGCYSDIGTAYYYSGDYQNALKYFYKAKDNRFFKQDPEVLFGFIGETYFGLNKLDSALLYLQKAYDLDIQKAGSHWSTPYYFLAAVNLKKGNPSRALEFYREGMSKALDKVNFEAYNGIASAFKEMGQIDSAIFYAKKVITDSMSAAFPPLLLETSRLLTNIYKSKNITDSAFKYQEIMLAIKDSLFSKEKVKQLQNLSFNEQLREQKQAEQQRELQNKIKLYSVIVALLVFLAIAFILYRVNRNKQKAYTLLEKQKQERDLQKSKAEEALQELKSTQAQLIQQEKMASLGELTAGIAHEIQNPLNFVNNFSEVNKELIEELKMKNEKFKNDDSDEHELLDDISQNNEKITFHGKRADAIVKGMLQHSRVSTGQKEPTDINALADEYLRLSYHGLRAKDKSFNAIIKTDFDPSIGRINIVPQDIGRVLLNLYNNAFNAINEKKGSAPDNFEPSVSVSTKKLNDKMEIKVSDNGNGIPRKVLDKIFQPFFTTKPTGQGTGLGLSLSYDIIKAHGGEIKVETDGKEKSTFIIKLPMST
jgi:signal transduction histidine kinase